jgi:hypothetical protein
LCACGITEPLQVTSERVTLVKIERVSRFRGDIIVLHWATDRGVIYISYPKASDIIPPLGTTDNKVFVRR